ncbi:MAG: hypothetical protein H8E48_09280 [Chloroflexi bacterium]|nr:hypothetical protein [Chloroflexota bacterium]
MSTLGIVVGYFFGYSVAILTVAAVLVSLGAIAGTIIGGKSIGGFIVGLLFTALMVWVSGIFHFIGGIAGLMLFRSVCETGLFGLSCAGASWPAIYAIGSLIGTLVVFCWVVASVVLDEIKFDVNADLKVSVEDQKRYPGDDVVVRVELAPRESFYLRRGVLRLVSWEIIHTEKGPIERELWSSEKRFGNSTHLVDRQVHSEEITVALPKTWETNFAGANWGVRVTLNIPGAKDIQGGQKFDVLLESMPQGTL